MSAPRSNPSLFELKQSETVHKVEPSTLIETSYDSEMPIVPLGQGKIMYITGDGRHSDESYKLVIRDCKEMKDTVVFTRTPRRNWISCIDYLDETTIIYKVEGYEVDSNSQLITYDFKDHKEQKIDADYSLAGQFQVCRPLRTIAVRFGTPTNFEFLFYKYDKKFNLTLLDQSIKLEGYFGLNSFTDGGSLLFVEPNYDGKSSTIKQYHLNNLSQPSSIDLKQGRITRPVLYGNHIIGHCAPNFVLLDQCGTLSRINRGLKHMDVLPLPFGLIATYGHEGVEVIDLQSKTFVTYSMKDTDLVQCALEPDTLQLICSTKNKILSLDIGLKAIKDNKDSYEKELEATLPAPASVRQITMDYLGFFARHSLDHLKPEQPSEMVSAKNEKKC